LVTLLAAFHAVSNAARIVESLKRTSADGSIGDWQCLADRDDHGAAVQFWGVESGLHRVNFGVDESNAVASTGLGGDTIAEVTAGLSARGRQLLSG
jgi:hypothetical protein